MHNPEEIIDIATLTGAIDVALGSAYAGLFTENECLAKSLISCGMSAGDEFWRMPLHPNYLKQIRSEVADLKNVGGKSAGSCTAAQFLHQFVEKKKWAHLDIAGVMENTGPSKGINVKGMSGRPTRSLIEYIISIS
jgi:aminopeptidase